MRVGWNSPDLPQPSNEAVRGVVFRDLRPHNRPGWSDITSAGPWAIDPGGSCDRHYHDCDEYWLVADGSARVEVDGSEVGIGPGDILCIERGRPHDIVALGAPLRAFWFEGPVTPGGRVGSFHRTESEAAGHAVAADPDSVAAAPADPALVVRGLPADGGPGWSDLAGAGSFQLESGGLPERRALDRDEYWLVREGAALVELDRERIRIGPGDVLCIERGRALEVIEVDGPFNAFWLRRP